MKRFILSFLVFAAFIPALAGSMRYDSNHILYWDDTSHLRYMLNTDTKEAILGDGIDEEKMPCNTHPWMMTGGQINQIFGKM